MKQLVVFLFLINAITSFSQDRENSTFVKLKQEVPSFSFTNEKGEIESIESLKGKVVMINFFATWCGPCLTELPHVQTDIYNKYKDHTDFRLLIFGREHKQEEVSAFKEKKGYSFEMMGDLDRKIYSKFASSFIPRNFIIDRDGKIIYSSIGFNTEDFDELKQILEEKLKQ